MSEVEPIAVLQYATPDNDRALRGVVRLGLNFDESPIQETLEMLRGISSVLLVFSIIFSIRSFWLIRSILTIAAVNAAITIAWVATIIVSILWTEALGVAEFAIASIAIPVLLSSLLLIPAVRQLRKSST